MNGMTKNRRWCKAMVVSCIAHMLLWVAVGLLGVKASTPPPEQEIIDMELIDDQAAAPGQSVSQTEQAVQLSARSEPIVQQPQPLVSQEAVAERYVAQSAAAGQLSGQTAASTTGAGNSSVGSGSVGVGNYSTGGEGNGKSYVSPQVLSIVKPEYPAEERRAGIEGTVSLKIVILENGKPGDIEVVRSSGSELLDNAAVEALRKWRFSPAFNKETGRPMKGRVTVPIKFELH